MPATNAIAKTCESLSFNELKSIVANLRALDVVLTPDNSDEVKLNCLGTLNVKVSEYGMVFYSYRHLTNPDTENYHINRMLFVFDSKMNYLGSYQSDYNEKEIKVEGPSIVFPKTNDPDCKSGNKITFTHKGPPKEFLVHCSDGSFLSRKESEKFLKCN